MPFNANGDYVPVDYTSLGSYGFPQAKSSALTLGMDPSSYGTAPSGATDSTSFWDNPFTKTNKDGITTQGYVPVGLGAAQGIFNAWLGMQNYGLAKQTLAASKQQFGLNYNAQAQTTNTELQDRQAARVASNPTAYQSVGDYMSQNGIKKVGA